jgi:hypothetical protein
MYLFGYDHEGLLDGVPCHIIRLIFDILYDIANLWSVLPRKSFYKCIPLPELA